MRCWLNLVVVLATLVWMTIAALAGAYEDAVAAAQRGDNETALRIFRSLASEGDAKGQFGLGSMYSYGAGVPKDDAEAAKWFRKAAEQGHADAQFSLGIMHTNGIGVSQDDAKALRWYRMAAEQGHMVAQHNIGAAYDKGIGEGSNSTISISSL